MMTSHAWLDGAQTRIAFNCQSILIFSYIYILTQQRILFDLFWRSCAMASTRVSVLPVPGGPKIT